MKPIDMSFSSTLPATIIAGILLGLSPAAMSHITGVVPDIVINQPPDVSLNQTESDTEIKGFDEQQCITLSFDLKTDQGRIQEGIPLSCHFFHADPVTSTNLLGRASFDGKIIGVISTSDGLYESDPVTVCGLANVIYPPLPHSNEPNRGLENFQPNDYYNVSGNRHKIEISVDVPSFSDQVRVITECTD